MTREQVERLAMDRAAGELNPDAEALLEQYLATNPEARSWADEMAAAHTQTQAAIAARVEDLDTSVLVRPVHSTAGSDAGRWSILGRAAVVLFAVLIGMGIGRWSQPPKITSKPTYLDADNTPAQKSLSVGLPGSVGGFWRGRALASLQTRPYRTKEVTRPKEGFWGRYKPSLKENSYE